jgi:hypothetical protein
MKISATKIERVLKRNQNTWQNWRRCGGYLTSKVLRHNPAPTVDQKNETKEAKGEGIVSGVTRGL